MAKDHFEIERSLFQRISDTTGELGVEVGEWTAEQLFGDPGLGPARILAIDIDGLLRIVSRLAREALQTIPGPDPESSS